MKQVIMRALVFICANNRCDTLIKVRGIITYKKLLYLNLFELYYMQKDVKLKSIVEITELVLNLFSPGKNNSKN